MNHTLGPWKVNFAQHRGDYSIDNNNSSVEIARTSNRDDARLIAAAPELLEALKSAVARLDGHERDEDSDDDCPRCGKYTVMLGGLRAVIAKAEGREGEPCTAT